LLGTMARVPFMPAMKWSSTLQRNSHRPGTSAKCDSSFPVSGDPPSQDGCNLSECAQDCAQLVQRPLHVGNEHSSTMTAMHSPNI
jgi:hypothetical protein